MYKSNVLRIYKVDSGILYIWCITLTACKFQRNVFMKEIIENFLERKILY